MNNYFFEFLIQFSNLQPMVIFHAVQCKTDWNFIMIIENTVSEVHNVQQNPRILLWILSWNV